MNLYAKKIIAKEFLILVASFLISFFAFASIYLYNYYLQSKYNMVSDQITAKEKLSDSLNRVYYEKPNNQYWFSYLFLQEFEVPNQTNTDDVWKRLEYLSKNDSIKIKWKSWDKKLISFIQQRGFETPEKFKDFIDSNTITSNDIKIHETVLSLRDEIKSLKKNQRDVATKKFSSQEQFRFGLIAFFILFICFFVCRYIFYGLQWSLRVLKQK